MPNEKKLKRLEALLDTFDAGAVQPDELIQAIDAVIAIIGDNSKAIAETINSNKLASEADLKRLKTDLGTAQENLKSLIAQVRDNNDTTVTTVRGALLKEIARVESLIPVLPPETDLSEVFENFENHRAEMARIGQLVIGENIRNALESLQGDDRLDKSAIRGLDEMLEEMQKGGKVVGAAGVRLLKYLADVNVEGITDGQSLVWDAATSKFIPGSGGGGYTDLTEFVDQTPHRVFYSNGSGDVTELALGADGTYLKSNGATSAPSFATPAGSGDVVGPASAVNNNFAAFDTTTGKLIKDSGVSSASFAAALGADDNYVTDAEKAALHAAVTVADSAEINLTLTGQQISASLVAGSIDESKLDVSVNASLDLADSASQPGHTHSLSAITDVTASAAEVNVLDGIPGTLTATELGYVDGVTSSIQTQLNGKEPTLAAASDTVAGKVELATAAETTTGTDATRAVTPDGLAGSEFGKRTVAVQVSGSASADTALATGDGLATIPVDSTLNGMNIIAVKAYVTTVSSSGNPTFAIRRSRRTNATTRSIVDTLSTSLSIDVSEFSSEDATTAAVINTSNDDLATGDMLLIDCDTAGTGTKGATILITCQLP